MQHFKEVGSIIVLGILLTVYGYLHYNEVKLLEIDILFLGVIFGAMPFILTYGWASRIRKIIGKPKLEFTPTIENHPFKFEKEDRKDSEQITFWLHIRNLGNDVAENCKIRLKITDSSGKKTIIEKTTHPTIDEDIPVSWIIAGQKFETRNISPSKYADNTFKIPFVMEFYSDDDSDSIFNKPTSKMYFEDPIKKGSWRDVIIHEKGVMGFFVEVIITSDIGEIARKKFVINLNDPISFEPIE